MVLLFEFEFAVRFQEVELDYDLTNGLRTREVIVFIGSVPRLLVDNGGGTIVGHFDNLLHGQNWLLGFRDPPVPNVALADAECRGIVGPPQDDTNIVVL
jgi:hypothetical protein